MFYTIQVNFIIFLVLGYIYENLAYRWYTQNSELLALHNAYRRNIKYGNVRDQPQAMSMLKLTWSHKLAEMAQEWALQCVPRRSNMTMRKGSKWTYVGQSIAFVPKVRQAASVWFEQHKNYNFENNTCEANKTCADYKQLAFADTTHIGCGYAMCFNLTGLDKVFVVCNYGPGGKYANRQPYDPIYPEDPYYLP
ncbi:unnamed protein product [Schistosoma rodhaini]|uniref:DIF_9 n=1 Tax=Schistosoma mansoni TaxID=6183 RepID=Q1WMM8_SCHMA|nr:venom allergen-like protein 7 [Schistosoma mansoni]ACK86683.1 DIF_9 [Schistosoma mansoni]CAH8629339.1 unnamed protein product [Schistosoma rodhaini]CAH8629354.1 unnamed protein product [Schistosoma rodhaini]